MDLNIVNSEDALLLRVMNFGIVLRFFGSDPSGCLLSLYWSKSPTLIIKKFSEFFRVPFASAPPVPSTTECMLIAADII